MNFKPLKTQAEQLKKEITTLQEDIAQPEIIKDHKKLQQLSQELSQKREHYALIEQLLTTEKHLQEAQEMSNRETDDEMRALAQEEVQKLTEKKAHLRDQLESITSGRSTKDVKSCILEIRAGTGGEEAALFAADLFRMYTRFAERKGWRVAIVNRNQTGSGGFKEIISQIDGKDIYEHVRFESGVHRVQRVPTTESSGRIHTSAASVVVYPLFESPDITLDPQDLKIDVYRSSGPGGQSVNTTDSAVRITHIPTGTIVTCQDEKSQHKNKKKALAILASRLIDQEQEKKSEEISHIRKEAIQTGDRSAKIRTYNFPQNRVTDHRIKKSWHNLKTIMEGNLDPVVTTLKAKLHLTPVF